MARHGTSERSEPSLVERLTAELREEILSGRLKPGDRIRQAEIGARAGASRVPAREALRQLEGEGLVTLTPYAGARVARLDAEELVEIYLVREHLEPLALAQSLPHLTLRDLERLGELHSRMQAAVAGGHPEVGSFLEIDRDFHILMTSGGPMRTLHRIVRDMINAAQPYRRAFSSTDPTAVLTRTNEEHERLLEAVRNNRAEDAEDLLRLHIRGTRESLQLDLRA